MESFRIRFGTKGEEIFSYLANSFGPPCPSQKSFDTEESPPNQSDASLSDLRKLVEKKRTSFDQHRKAMERRMGEIKQSIAADGLICARWYHFNVSGYPKKHVDEVIEFFKSLGLDFKTTNKGYIKFGIFH